MRVPQSAVLVIASAVFAFFGGGCGRSAGSDSGKPVVAVTFPQQASLLREIVGDSYEIITLLPPGSDPENYEPSMSTMKALTRAEIYFTMGSPGFEQSVLKGVKANFPDMFIVDSATGIERLSHIHGDGGHHHHDGEEDDHHCGAADPHILTSVMNARKMSANMTDALARLRPENKTRYAEGFHRLDSILANADDSIRGILCGGSRPFVVLHPSLSYFARDYKLEQISLEYEGKEPSPRQYAETISRITDVSPAIFVSERQHSSERFKETAREIKVPVIEVDLISEDWLSPLYQIANSVSINRQD